MMSNTQEKGKSFRPETRIGRQVLADKKRPFPLGLIIEGSRCPGGHGGKTAGNIQGDRKSTLPSGSLVQREWTMSLEDKRKAMVALEFISKTDYIYIPRISQVYLHQHPGQSCQVQPVSTITVTNIIEHILCARHCLKSPDDVKVYPMGWRTLKGHSPNQFGGAINISLV